MHEPSQFVDCIDGPHLFSQKGGSDRGRMQTWNEILEWQTLQLINCLHEWALLVIIAAALCDVQAAVMTAPAVDHKEDEIFDPLAPPDIEKWVSLFFICPCFWQFPDIWGLQPSANSPCSDGIPSLLRLIHCCQYNVVLWVWNCSKYVETVLLFAELLYSLQSKCLWWFFQAQSVALLKIKDF